MARTSITTLYTGFLCFSGDIRYWGRQKPRRRKNWESECKPDNVGLKGKTAGSSDIQGVAQQKNSVKGRATGSGNVANVVTGNGTLRPKGDLKKGDVAGVTVKGNLGGEPESNSQKEKPQTYESHY
ncbi:hypothetical protein MKW92_001558 [Papaver armeniacum]|nr:hypothetical protein MKW92_001558 [Papaver armeniacum]